MQIKVCGIRFKEEAEELKNLKYIDYFGIVLDNDSPYRVSLATARILADIFHAAGKKIVGVFKDQYLEEVKSAVKACKFDVIQLNGVENPDYCRKLGGVIWKRFTPRDDVADMVYYMQYIEYLVIACENNESDWQMAASWQSDYVLSGEISIDNMGAACNCHPMVMDLCRNFETADRKDKAKIIQAIQIIMDLGSKK